MDRASFRAKWVLLRLPTTGSSIRTLERQEKEEAKENQRFTFFLFFGPEAKRTGKGTEVNCVNLHYLPA